MGADSLRAVASHPRRLSADFEFGQQYHVVFDEGRRSYLVDDEDGCSVASLPVEFGGRVRTRTETWLVRPEHHRVGWELVARDLDREFAGGISEGLIPYTFKLRVADDHDYRVTESPFNGHWTVSHRHSHIARISGLAAFAWGRPPKEPKRVPDAMVSPFTSPDGHRRYRGEIATFDRVAESPPIAPAILLTLEMIKAEAVMSDTKAGGGVGSAF
jgi:hypothetical protein